MVQIKISDLALTAIKEPAIRRKLAEALDCTDQTIMKQIKENIVNGDLTKVASLKIIKDTTGLSDEMILVDADAEESAAKVNHERA